MSKSKDVTISDDQIMRLRARAERRGMMARVVLCDIALGEFGCGAPEARSDEYYEAVHDLRGAWGGTLPSMGEALDRLQEEE